MNAISTMHRAFGPLIVTLAILGYMWVATPVVLADDYQCTGSVGAETKDNIQVPDNATCSLNGTIVGGTIYVGTDSTLGASGVKVDGNIQSQGSTKVTVDNNSTVGGSIQIKQGGAATVTNVKVTGDILFDENNSSIAANNNEVGGNLQAFKNTGGLAINNNQIDGNLQCKENNPAPTGGGNQAASLEDQCSGLGSEGDSGIQRHGRIDSFPAAPFVGTWLIDGVSYTANASTQFEQEYGAFGNDVCVEVEASATTPPVAKQIETEEDYQCSGRTDDDDDDAEGELYGTVTKFPAGLVGTWIIGDNRSFEATNQTEFDRSGREFAIGVTVRIEFTTGLNGGHTVREIEIVYGSDDDDDDDYGEAYGAEGQAYGRLDTKGGKPGTWVIGSIEYLVNAGTELDDDADLVVGARVKVEYTVRSDGSRVAHEIEDTDDDGDVSSDDHSKLVGFVQQMPATGFMGTWKVAGMAFAAGPGTGFKQEHGTFAGGSYVEVEYYMDGSTRRIYEVETEVPPGAGDDDRMGKIQAIGAPGQAVAAAPNASMWQIGGVSYIVTPATQLIDRSGELVVGATALVNSYLAADGSRVATRIQAYVEVERIHLPVLQQ